MEKQSAVGAQDKYQAIGRRKESQARVCLVPGDGKITVNKLDFEKYFQRETLKIDAIRPLADTNLSGKFDVRINVRGGGLSGQAGAIKMGIARALVKYEDSLRKPLRQEGFLTRDARMKERKKYGQKRARKRFQFTKR